jgi:hypothetical protein
MGENTIVSFSESESASPIDAEYKVDITVGTDPCQLLYDGQPADQANVKVGEVGAKMVFKLTTLDYEFTHVAPNTGELKVISISGTSIIVVSNLEPNCSGKIIFTVSGCPTPPASGPEVTNDGSGLRHHLRG